MINFHNKNILKKNTHKAFLTGIIALMTVMSLTACGSASGTAQSTVIADVSETKADIGFVAATPDSYDSADTPVVVKKNTDDNTVTLLNLDLGKKYTLSFDGTTKFYDKYGESISFEQIDEGDVVDVTFLKSKKHLTTMTRSSDAWHYENVERFEFNSTKKEVSIGDEIYKLSDDVVYLSEGRLIDEMDLNAADVLTFQGMDKTVLSVIVEKGHGYLRLDNAESFVGGWIEIGQTQIQKITEDMLLAVPEGSYQVNITYKNSGGTKNVIINRDEETVLDIGDLKVEEPRTGTILFSLTPSDATLYVDGSEVDTSSPVVLEYGIHQLIAKADGYQSVTQYLRVGDDSAGINIVLDAVSDSVSDGDSSDSSSTVDTTTDYYKVYIDAPESAEVYLDGSYVGVVPCSFKKVSGSHVISLRKSGYQTKSYTVQIDDEEKDISYSFADLVSSSTTSSTQSVNSLVSDVLSSILGN